MNQLRSRERGFSLVLGLIILVVLTVLLVSAIRSNTTNLRIVGNAQVVDEAIGSAQQVIEEVISYNFTTNPVPVTRGVDVNGDAQNDFTVTVTPRCIANVPLLSDFPGIINECLPSATMTQSGQIVETVEGTNTTAVHAQSTQSWCSQQTWDLRGVATPAGTSAITRNVEASVTQGVSIFVPVGTDC